MCYTYKVFQPSDDRKKKTLDGLEELADFYRNEFDSLRRQDADYESITNVRENKSLCLDAISACEECSKEVDKVNRLLLKLKQ